MAEVLGRNARALRESAGATLEDVAKIARLYGLRWSSGSVGSLESGRTVGVNLENLIKVAATLGDIVGHPVKLADLFAGDGDVALGDDLTVPLAMVRDMFSSEGEGVWIETVSVPRIAGGYFPAVGTVKYSPVQRSVLDAFRETDIRACKGLGVEPVVGAKAMAKLWKSTLTAERDRRASSDANAQARGRISRTLKAELAKELNRGHR
jgi:transcriptional regulator with XRE-family HTH domain